MSGNEERHWRIFVPLLRGDGEAFLERLGASEDGTMRLMSFLQVQRLAATVAAAVEDLGLMQELPQDLHEQLRAQRRSQFLLALANLEAASELHIWLTSLGVAHLFLKGPLMGLRAYGRVESRTVGDIDLLVDSNAIEQVEEELCLRGYEARYGTLGGRRLSRFFTHHFSYSKKQMLVEVHWDLVCEAGIQVDMEAVWAQSESLQFRGTDFPVPSLETSLLLQILAVAKDLELGLLMLRSFADTRALALALGAGFDWTRFLSEVSRQGAGGLASAVLELTFRLMECRADLPELAAAIARTPGSSSRLDLTRPTLGLRVFGLQPPAWQNRKLLFPLHRGGGLATWAWWAFSLHFRKAVYRDS